MNHKIKFTETSRAELASLSKEVTDKLWDNFIQPVKNGLTPPDELQGKYKPSWASKFVNSPMKLAFVENAENKKLHHYHFGYRFYINGKDPDYDGDVSDGIVHTRIESLKDLTSHIILQVCLEHPSPFKYPFERSDDQPVEDKVA